MGRTKDIIEFSLVMVGGENRGERTVRGREREKVERRGEETE